MTKQKQRIMRVIRKSCLTGRAIWIGHKRSHEGEWKAYKRAARREIERIRNWGNVMERRKANVKRMLSSITANIPLRGNLTMEKKKAARELNTIADKTPSPDNGFYNHLIEELRKRDGRQKYTNNPCYDK